MQIDRVQGIHVQDVCVTSEAADSPLQGFMALLQAVPSATSCAFAFYAVYSDLGYMAIMFQYQDKQSSDIRSLTLAELPVKRRGFG